jgi:hypothetical protein
MNLSKWEIYGIYADTKKEFILGRYECEIDARKKFAFMIEASSVSNVLMNVPDFDLEIREVNG